MEDTGEVRRAKTGDERQPVEGTEAILHEERGEAAGGADRGVGQALAAIVGRHAETFVITLKKAIAADVEVIARDLRVETELASGVGGAALLARADRLIVRRSRVVGAVVVEERRSGKQRVRVEGMHPTRVNEYVGLAVGIA